MKHRDFDSGPGLLPEMLELYATIEALGSLVTTQQLATVTYRDLQFPIIGLTLGSSDKRAPVFALFGGVHGLERIGTRIVLAYLQTIAAMSQWDDALQSVLERVRFVALPIVNPLGMYLQQRSNANGVDLMRNSPCEARDLPKYNLPGGHRISPRLPWYRGAEDDDMEIEAAAMCRFVEQELYPSSCAISVDVHSGYGTRDRLWFPYARSKEPFPNAADVLRLKSLFEAAYPYHNYVIEPQSKHYRSHGDLWDYLYDRHRLGGRAPLFLPFTLELGSWIWVKKSVRQLFSLFGVFNPVAKHRQRRTLRRHTLLFDFMLRACASQACLSVQSPAEQESLSLLAQRFWYDS